jgi:15-cis-phytoene synthase
MQLRHDPTFYWATARLPRERRPAVHALYGYVRGADELVDGGALRGAPPEQRRAALDAWERTLGEGRAAGRSEHPVIAALVDAEQRHALPLDCLGVYMRSMRVDCGPVRLRDRGELDAYMDGSAAAVGRVMAPLLGCDEPEAMARLGVAFQLTNFIRDVREDWELDRVYLPGLPEHDLAHRRPSDDVRGRVAEEVGRARALFAETEDVPAEPTVRAGMRLARSVYERVLDRVERLEFDVLRRRAGLAPWELARAAVNGLR